MGCLNPSKPPPSSLLSSSPGKVVLHLPLVSLRGPRQNPTLAVASRLAARLDVPLVTVYQVCAPDDVKGKFLTPRRLAFMCEAIESSAASCAGVCDGGSFVVAQGVNSDLDFNQCVASLLNLCFRHAAVVVTDEPFVDPYLRLVTRLEKALPCQLWRVRSSSWSWSWSLSSPLFSHVTHPLSF